MKKSRDQLAAAIILVFMLLGVGALVSYNTGDIYQAENPAIIETSL